MLMRTVSLTALALCVVMMTGCLKMKQVVTVMPDGSGKVEFTMGVSDTMIQQSGENPIDEFTLENMMEEGMPNGLVAMTEPEKWEDDGYEYVRFSMYFDDINEFTGPNGEEEMFADYEFTNDGGACTLTVRGGLIQSMLAEYEVPGPEELQMIQAQRAQVEGFEIVEEYYLPGEAEAVEGFEMIDNMAGVTIDVDNLINGDGPIPALQNRDQLVLVVGETSLAQAEIDAFAEELAQAVEDWETLKEEMEME